jgi:hypothetical protein
MKPTAATGDRFGRGKVELEFHPDSRDCTLFFLIVNMEVEGRGAS